jgi:biopolymer transport protein TolR
MADPRKTPPTPPPAGEKPPKKRVLLHSHDAFQPAHSDAVSDINITPLIDVMLVLLIIFMVVTPVAQKGMDIALPQTDNSPKDTKTGPEPVVLALEESGGITVNRLAVTGLEELETRLKEIFQTKTDKTMFVKASGKVLYGKVVEAMDVARGAGVERIGIMTEKMEKGEQ